MTPHEINDYVFLKADWVEFAWVVITATALLVNLVLLRVAIHNRHALTKLNVNGLRKYAANTQTIREIIRLVMQMALVAVGIRSVTIPNYAIPHRWDYYYFISCMMAVGIGMAVAALIDYFRFKHIMDEIERQGLDHGE